MTESLQSMHLLSGAYAVNALDPAERDEFEAHLADCPDCSAEVRGLLDTTARLAAAEAVTPPARLKAAVMAQIANTRQLAPLAEGTETSDPSVETHAVDDAVGGPRAAAAASRSDDGVVVPMRRPGWSWAQRSLAAAAAFLAVVAIGLSALLAQSNSSRNQLDATQATVTRVLTAADARTLTGSLADGGRATVVVSPSQGESVFLGTDLPAAPSGHTYELWYMGAAGAVPAGTFDPDSSGHATEVLSGAIGSASAIGVTVEPAGGSAKPTTTPVLALKLTG
jgi:anti-sigma-K factor RskA